MGASPADNFFRANWREIERLRRLVPEAADRHLYQWGIWRRQGVVTTGYADHVPGMDIGIGRCVAEDASDHDYEDNAMHSAEVCDVIITELPIHYRTALSHVYEAAVWRFRSDAVLEQYLIAGASAFWRVAQGKGLV